MNKFVIDTSVIFKALFFEENRQELGREKALNLFNRAEHGEIYLLAPSLIWYELNNFFVTNNFSNEYF